MSEQLPSHEFEAIKEQFLENLGEFIIEAGKNGWAAEAPKVETPQRPGFKELAYQRDEWEYRDSYAGYYMGPGSSVVYYKERPVWYMSYGGQGQDQRYYDLAKATYVFLRKALMHPHPKLPVRGPLSYENPESNKMYWFDFEGDLSCGSWSELILDNHVQVFSQRGDVGLIIDKDENRNPIYPWDL